MGATVRLLLLVLAGFGSGCASLTNPVADGVPVRRVPAEVLGRPKSEMVDTPLTLLRIREPEAYKLDKGDTLAIVAGDVFAPLNTPPPVNPQIQLGPGQETEAATGYPVPVSEDGTITLPAAGFKPLSVKGLTVKQAEEKLRRALTLGEGGQPKIFQPNAVPISVMLQRKRRYKVTVIREDTQPIPGQAAGGVITTVNRRNGFPIFMEAYKNDVLTALTLSGGPPGLDARNEVVIQRGTYDPAAPEKSVTRIPLRAYPEDRLELSEASITLNEGDILVVPSRANEVFYTGGVVGSRQVSLPRDYDLDVLQAIALVGGPLANGGFTQNAFVAQAFASGIGNPSPVLVSVLRKMPNGQQLNIRVDLGRALRDRRERILMMPDDVLVLQEKPGDAITRYLTQQFRFTTVADTIRSENIVQTLNATIP